MISKIWGSNPLPNRTTLLGIIKKYFYINIDTIRFLISPDCIIITLHTVLLTFLILVELYKIFPTPEPY